MKINGNNVLKWMAFCISRYLQYWRWYRARYDPGSKRSRSRGFPNWVLTAVTPCLWNCIGHVKRFAMRYRKQRADGNSGGTGVGYPTIVREGPNLANRCGRPRRPLRMVSELWIAWAVSGKTIYRWIREKIKRLLVKSGSRNLDVVRQYPSSRPSRMRAQTLRIAHFQDIAQSQS